MMSNTSNLAGALDFSGKHVFVAGGSSGINLAIGEAFARQGAKVTLVSRSAERVEAAAAGLREQGADALGLSADVRDAGAIQAALATAHQAYGPIDVLISGAAGNFLAPASGMSANGFRTVIDIDLNGTFHVLRGAHEFLRKPGAAVLNISAPQAFNPTPYQAHVCAAKAGIDMLTRVLAMEWGPDGVRINSLVPGPIGDTEGIRRLAPSAETLKVMEQTVPMRRLGRTDEIANMATVLCSPLASFVTGAVLTVDGGSSLLGGRDYTEAYAASQRARAE
ncbi:2,4-dienoyl-CoA reductase [Alcanivorax sp. S71-1-4]|uniref:SDR family oxidoreductase n=1 Tax=Alcanivorax sp. S71-1-4 TaxID=1177159 RepID=UPI00169EC4C7|nr:SDR family oxidoreductase [Alcanivorax sp. S71-1-4]KAF0807913.1 2,4-dienoyl-CoA reductase [Alcanivorax sp. S71-1-4]